MSDLISKRFIQDALIEKISNLNAEGETRTAKELIRLKKFVDGLTPYAETQPITCDGCKHVGTYDTDFPCSGCIRREKDYYESEE